MSAPTDGSGIVYLDASALVKLIAEEIESAALEAHLAGRPRRVTSELAMLELLRAIRRREPQGEHHVAGIIQSVGLQRLDRRVMIEAAALPPRSLGALDSIHLATALRLKSALIAFVTYDRALGRAAAAAGLPVASPA